MKELPTITRPLNDQEKKQLLKKKAFHEKELAVKIKYHYFAIALLIGAIFTFLASKLDSDNFLVFIFGTIAVVAFSMVVFMPFEILKDRKISREMLAYIETVLSAGSITNYNITATDIAMAPNYEDEGDLYFIELDHCKTVALWDYGDFSFPKKKFPCLHFEIYADEKLSSLLENRVVPKSEKYSSLKIDPGAKWAAMKQDTWADLEIRFIKIAAVIEGINKNK